MSVVHLLFDPLSEKFSRGQSTVLSCILTKMGFLFLLELSGCTVKDGDIRNVMQQGLCYRPIFRALRSDATKAAGEVFLAHGEIWICVGIWAQAHI